MVLQEDSVLVSHGAGSNQGNSTTGQTAFLNTPLPVINHVQEEGEGPLPELP